MNFFLSGKGCVCYLELSEPTKCFASQETFFRTLVDFFFFLVKQLKTAVSGNSLIVRLGEKDAQSRIHPLLGPLCESSIALVENSLWTLHKQNERIMCCSASVDVRGAFLKDVGLGLE